MVWVAVSAHHLIGPYFFDVSVIQHSYLHVLENYLTPELERCGLAREIYFQQDGAPVHHACAAQNYPNQFFPQTVGLAGLRQHFCGHRTVLP